MYFTSINRCMNFGGIFLSSKYSYLKKIPAIWIPKTCIINKQSTVTTIKSQLAKHNLSFPIIAKPDIGERGKSVAKISCLKDLASYCQHTKYQTIILQQYIEYPVELGVLFYRDNDGIGKITSIGLKKFCTITGNGKSTLGKLVVKNPRISVRKKELKSKFSNQWDKILKKGESILIEPIGNHNLGTMFLNGNYRYSTDMLDWINSVASKIPNFDYGRFDLRIKNWDSFKNRTGIKILEINGVNSEPIHIYSPKFGLINAYRELFTHMRIIQRLSSNKIDTPTVSINNFLRAIVDFKNKKEQHALSITI